MRRVDPDDLLRRGVQGVLERGELGEHLFGQRLRIGGDRLGAAEALWFGEGIDAILLDVHLRDGDGLELLGRMRAKQAGPPVALFTGSVELDAATRAAAEAVVAKPFTLDELSGAVARLVGP